MNNKKCQWLIGLILNIFLFNPFQVFAVNTLDSLADAADRMENTIEKVNIFLDLSEKAVSSHQLKAVKFASKATFIAKRINYNKGIADGKYQLMLAYYYMNNTEDALRQSRLAIEKYTALGDEIGLGKTYHIMGKIYSFAGQPREALEFTNKGLKIFKNTKEEKWIADSYSALGMFKFQINVFKDGIPFIKKAIPHYQTDSIANAKSLIRAYILLGIAYNGLQQYQECVIYNEKALRLAKATDDLYNITVSKTNLGWTYYLIKEYKKAAKYCEEALKNAEIQNDKYSIAHNYKCLGAVYTQLEDFTKAEENLNIALGSNQNLKAEAEEAEIYKLFSIFYQQQGDFKKALSYHQQYHQLSDTINKNLKEIQLQHITKQFETTQEETSFDFQSTSSVQRRNFNIVFIAALILGLVIIGLGYRYYHQRKLYTQQLQQEADNNAKALNRLNQEMQKFNYIASNDLKQPMRNVMSFAGLLHKKLKIKNEDQALVDYSGFVLNGAKQMYDVILGVLEFSGIDHTTTTLKNLNTLEVIQTAQASLGDFVERQNANIIISPNIPKEIISNETHLRLIFKHLIKNGIMYNQSETPQVEIDYVENALSHSFMVKDNGIGIEEQYHKEIFEMFKSKHTQNTHHGSGMGLSLTKKLVESLDGTIQVQSKIDEGSTFIVELPK
jgi:signal transduction histidine kinase